MSEPRPVTPDELRDDLLAEMKGIARFWADAKSDIRERTVLERIEGALFSVLVLLDGHAGMCSFDLVARPHEDDKQYSIDQGGNWVEDGTTISDVLHERWHGKGRGEHD